MQPDPHLGEAQEEGPEEMSSKSHQPQMLTLDSLVRTLFGLLQIIGLAWLGWLTTTVLDARDRQTRTELRLDGVLKDVDAYGDMLSKLNERQQTILQLLASVQPDLARIKADITEITRKVDGK